MTWSKSWHTFFPAKIPKVAIPCSPGPWVTFKQGKELGVYKKIRRQVDFGPGANVTDALPHRWFVLLIGLQVGTGKLDVLLLVEAMKLLNCYKLKGDLLQVLNTMTTHFGLQVHFSKKKFVRLILSFKLQVD